MFKKLLLTTAVFGLVGFGSQAIAHEYHDHGEKMDEAKAEAETMMEKDIVDTAMADAQFSVLVGLLKATGLTETLKGEGPFTVFAPTNEAFDALPEEALADLLKPENKEKLASVLTYHVVPAKVMASDIQDGTNEVATVEGGNLNVVKSEDGVKINDANVTATDIKTSNGVIHVIDAVVLPDNNS
ncbi:MAG: fasciclin domain-containing protein [Alphaproteobacteria bacterium]